jgi:hypothetical protein
LWWNLLFLGAAGIVGSVVGVFMVGGIGGAVKGFGAGVLIAIVVYVSAAFSWFQ